MYYYVGGIVAQHMCLALLQIQETELGAMYKMSYYSLWLARNHYISQKVMRYPV